MISSDLPARSNLTDALARVGVQHGFDESADRALTTSLPAYWETTSDVIGSDDPMVVASYGFQTLTSRVAAVLLAGAATIAAAPTFRLEHLRWRALPRRFGVVIGVDPFEMSACDLDHAVDVFVAVCREWVAATRGSQRIAERLLWGNAAASFGAALRRLSWKAAIDQPTRDAALSRFVAAAGARSIVEPRIVDDHWTFQRLTCCLLTKAGGLGICEECSLLSADEFVAAQRATRRSFVRATGLPDE